ncbi:DUF3231 family protein [Halalkalibacter akibai]|uniref:DUF3231 family protein n=1 Tax=Halalkalibacter akibai (strain ATCC 43226 / DSM 21942 / CIP 109018 / JCM 9157 / 1139) TaxID=1236973 RepID=W4QTU9_HALA3|nr:DUF3231 family protein [Halalkalibacter akibai]GAE34759.1 hypothetical protein JCM9157_1836 [Halalkalibacter akibai JCM 9157]
MESRIIRLTSAEISTLWTAYMNNSMASCVLSYFVEKAEDQEIKSVLEFALSVAKKNVNGAKVIFEGESYPIPKGFTEEDVNLKAKRLWADTLFLHYVDQMAKSGFAAYGMSVALSSRLDVREYFNDCLDLNQEINNKAKNIALSKGIHVRPPILSYPEKIDFVKEQSFLAGWFGDQKPLLASEIMHFFHNVQTNAIGKALIMGFSQVASSPDVRDYFKRGKEIAIKQIKVFHSILQNEDIPTPMTWDSEVMNSIEAPFSDKLMVYHIALLNIMGLGNYGMAISTSTRRDLIKEYMRLSGEIGLYAEDGANLMIKHGWMEEPPQAVDREKLSK